MRPEIKNTSDSDMESVFSTQEPKTPGYQPTADKYTCSHPGCSQTFRRLVHLDRHEFKHTGVRKHKCFHEGCTKAYTIITHLKRHIKVFHEKVPKIKDIKCSFDFCPKKFSSTYSRERHIREVHHNPKIYECTHCDEKFTQKLKLRRHEVKHTGVHPYNCSKCSKGFVQEYFLKRHICKSYVCVECQTKFTKWSELMAHRKAAHHKLLHKCEHCERKFESKFEMDEHRRTHDEDKEVFACPYTYCSRFYSYKKNLTQHLRIAHEGKTFPCTVEGCESKLSSKKGLENHVKARHGNKTLKPKQAKKERVKRKDAGKRKQSTLSKLSGVEMEKELDKMVMEGTAEVDIYLPPIEEEIKTELTKTGADRAEDQQLVILKVKGL